MAIRFRWDPRKARSNQRKHGISFPEATTVFADPLSVTIEDPDHSVGERRYLLAGMTVLGHLVVVAHSERGDEIRRISARRTTPAEREAYEEGQ